MEPRKIYYPGFWPAVKLLFLLVIITLTTVFIGQILKTQHIPVAKPVFEALAYIVSAAIVVWYGLRAKYKHDHEKLVNRKISWIAILLLCVAILCLGILLEPIENIIPMSGDMEKLFEETFFSLLKQNLVLGIFSLAIIPAVFEEMIFRGIILNGFLKNYSPLMAVLLSALLFGLIHLNPWQFIGGFAGGLLLGWVYHKTYSLVACMLMHAINNFTAVVLYLVMGNIKGSIFQSVSRPNYIMLYLATLILFVACIYTLNRKFDKEKADN